MHLINKMRDFLIEDEFKINIYKNKINLVNYTEIVHFNDNSVIVAYPDQKITVKGENLIVSALVNNEVLITGKIKTIELR